MAYRQTKPHPFLYDYIDAYWTVISDSARSLRQRILPDGCVDIILDLHGNERPILVGTMTSFKMVEMRPGASVTGIRFKPAAFAAFFRFDSMDHATDLTIELDREFCFDLKKLHEDANSYLDRFFLERLNRPKHVLFPVIANIEDRQGLISVRELCKDHFITERQLERNFKQYVGISPKAFVNFVRYKYVIPAIRKKLENQSLLDIAITHGYYDHAHLSNEIKRYSGLPPSEI